MAVNTLNTLYGIEQRIKALEIELKDLRGQEKKLIGQCLESKSMENRYYRLTNKVIRGDRKIDIVLLKEKYPDIAPAIIKETVSVTDAKKKLGDDLIDQISTRQADSITWFVEKKESSPVVVV